jgi:hypothetical protein
VFEHLNVVKTSAGGVGYVPDIGVHRLDSNTFEELIAERRQLAWACVARGLSGFPGHSPPGACALAAFWEPGSDSTLCSSRCEDSQRPVLVREHARRVRGPSALSQRLAKGIPGALFDPEWYVTKYPDAAGDTSPLVHYLRYGGFERRDPNPHLRSVRVPKSKPAVRHPLLRIAESGSEGNRGKSARALRRNGLAARAITPG